MIDRKIYIPQVDEMDCGVRALAMILKDYGSSASLAYLRNEAKTDLEGTTALGLVKTAENLGFETKAIEADMSLFEVADLPFPFIAHVLKKWRAITLLCCTRDKKRCHIIADPDPTVGIAKMTQSQFKSEWTGVALFIAPKPSYQPVKQQTKASLFSFVPTLMQQKRLVINITLAALLITIISILGSYFLQTVIDTYIPNNMQSTLAIVAIGLIIFYGFQSIFTYASKFFIGGFRTAVIN
uniref:Putative ATP-dependent translocator protein n=1 Tax=Latilactobacillus sakei TaxID=1599 RepID=O51819_LATSK|nr:putative ATP-dependent translocator protein [Latilactobacillus sakei]